MSTTGIAAILAFAAGLGGAVQIAVQGRLGERVGSLEALTTAAVIGGVIALAVLLVVRRSLRRSRRGVRRPEVAAPRRRDGSVHRVRRDVRRAADRRRRDHVVPHRARSSRSPTAIDRYGWFGVERIAITWPRVVGIGLLVRRRGADAQAVSVLADLEPRGVWTRFAELTRIPRPPKDEERVREHVVAWAGERGFESEVDCGGKRPRASAGVARSRGRARRSSSSRTSTWSASATRTARTTRAPGRSTSSSAEDWVVGAGTTLGADNGIGVAAAMAVAEDAAVEHGPLELLFTVCEERAWTARRRSRRPSSPVASSSTSTGQRRARSRSAVRARPTRTRASARRSTSCPAGYATLRVVLGGARGGHSGRRHRARTRQRNRRARPRALTRRPVPPRAPRRRREPERDSARGRGRRRARGCRGADLPRLRPSASSLRFASSTPAPTTGSTLAIEPTEPQDAADDVTTARVLDLLATIPSGVDRDEPGRPRHRRDEHEPHPRGDRGRRSHALVDDAERERAGARGGARADRAPRRGSPAPRSRSCRSYPPWRPDLDSRLLGVARATFERVNGVAASLEIVHGGPRVRDHRRPAPWGGDDRAGTGDRRSACSRRALSIPATQRFYRLLGALLDDLSR